MRMGVINECMLLGMYLCVRPFVNESEIVYSASSVV